VAPGLRGQEGEGNAPTPLPQGPLQEEGGSADEEPIPLPLSPKVAQAQAVFALAPRNGKRRQGDSLGSGIPRKRQEPDQENTADQEAKAGHEHQNNPTMGGEETCTYSRVSPLGAWRP
jgi:hypothetical protein